MRTECVEKEMGRYRKESFYEGDEGNAIQQWMRTLDIDERQRYYSSKDRRIARRRGVIEPEPITVDQEDDDWEEKLYER